MNFQSTNLTIHYKFEALRKIFMTAGIKYGIDYLEY
jgi:hypothetical protein